MNGSSKFFTGALVAAQLILAATTAHAQGPTPNQSLYPGAAWPGSKKLPETEDALSREEFLKRYGVTDSAIAIIKMFYYQDKVTQRRSNTFAIQQFDNTSNYNKPGRSPSVLSSKRERQWSSEHLYQTLYQLHATGKLPRTINARLPVYLERLQELRNNPPTTAPGEE